MQELRCGQCRRKLAEPSTPAALAYDANLHAVEALLKEIQLGIQGHAKRAAQEPWDWGFAGDMGYCEKQLADIRDGLFGRTR